MHERFLSYIKQENLLKSGDSILLAVSGGLDSMVMLDLFINAEWKIGVAHINHHLRAEESDEDAVFISQYCKNKRIPFFQLDLEPNELIAGNMQSNARNKRYEWLNKIATEYKYDHIATAHHKDDEIESFMINLMRGSGIDGLHGISSRRDLIIRPILFCSRQEISTYASEKSLPYREDSSNMTDKYLRNRIRHHILPEIYATDSRSVSGLLKSIENLSEVKNLLDFFFESYTSAFLKTTDGITSIDLERLKITNVPVPLLFNLLKPFGYNHHQCKDIILKYKMTGNQYLSSTHVATLDRKYLLITKITPDFDDNLYYSIDGPCTVKIAGVSYIFEIVNNVNETNYSQNVQYLEADHLKFPLRLRHWRPGDRFSPLGMRGKTQKIKDFLINNKVPRPIKDKVMVLENAGIIISVLNFRVAQNVSVTSDTKQILAITTIHQE